MEYKPSLTHQQNQLYLPVKISSFDIGVTSILLQPRLPPDGREGEDWIGMTLQCVRVVPLA
jgi:hypothetical protein